MSAFHLAVSATGAALMLCGTLCLIAPFLAGNGAAVTGGMLAAGVAGLWLGAELVSFVMMRGPA